MTSFADLGLRDALVRALAAEGIETPFPIQEQTIRDTLAGRDVCGKAKTGSGKTLAFGLPMLEKLERPDARKAHPQGLILAPTRELAGQIVEALKPLARAVDLRVDAFYGGTNIDRQLTALKRGVDIAVATPGRLIDLLDRRAVRLDHVRMVVIDEADHMADMGFLPQVEWIMRRLNAEAHPQVLLFSATLDGDIDVLVRHHLTDPVRHEVVDEETSTDNMVHRFFEVHQMDRVRVAASIIKGASRTITFVRTKRGADRLARQLVEEGVQAAAIHGDLRQTARERALKKFAKGELEVLVATDVAARGIHVDEIDVVVHFDLPEDPKDYVHRSGRTARAGSTGTVVTFVLWNQVYEAERLKKALDIDEPTVAVFSNDTRLADVAGFESTEAERATGTEGAAAVVRRPAAAASPGRRPRRGGGLGRGGRGGRGRR